MTLTDHVASYIDFQRATGLSFQHTVPLLASFAAHAGAEGDAFVRTETCIAWASQAKSSRQRQRRLRLVRQLALHLHAEDERHEVPHPDSLGRGTYHRPPPRPTLAP